jgi:DNA gyrase subunit B
VSGVYDDSQIKVLKGLEPVRRRPAMYVGPFADGGPLADGAALHNLIEQAARYVIGSHRKQNATELHVDVSSDSWITVWGDDPGLSVARARRDNRTVVELVLTELLVPGDERNNLAITNALSSQLHLETTAGGKRWAQSFARGEVTSTLRDLGATSREGTLFRFRPDPDVFTSINLDLDRLVARFQELAWLNPLLRIWVNERRIYGRGGIAGWAESIAGVQPLLAFHRASRGLTVDLALAWRSSNETTIHCFANERESNKHVDELFQGLADALGTTSEKARDALSPGLAAVMHVANDFGYAHPGTALEIIGNEMPGELWPAQKQFFEKRLATDSAAGTRSRR